VIEGAGNGYSKATEMLKAPDEKERLKAAELLGKRHSLFTEKIDVTNSAITVVIENDYGDNEN